MREVVLPAQVAVNLQPGVQQRFVVQAPRNGVEAEVGSHEGQACKHGPPEGHAHQVGRDSNAEGDKR
jgi:hypothetical protein